MQILFGFGFKRQQYVFNIQDFVLSTIQPGWEGKKKKIN